VKSYNNTKQKQKVYLLMEKLLNSFMLNIYNQNLFAGTKGSWSEYFPDYSTSEYNLTVLLKCANKPTLEIIAEKDGDEFVIKYDNNLIDGFNNFQYILTRIDNSEKIVAYEGIIEIKSILSSIDDSRSEDQRILDELISARLRIAKREYVDITINGKATRFKTLDQIDREIMRYKKKLGLYKTPIIIQAFK